MSEFYGKQAKTTDLESISDYAKALKKVCNLSYNYTNIELRQHCSRSLMSYHLLKFFTPFLHKDSFLVVHTILDNMKVEVLHINENALNVIEVMLTYELKAHIDGLELGEAIKYKQASLTITKQIIEDLKYLNC